MEIAIDCSCGTQYTFETEPVNGQMVGTIQCPECGIDGTEAANGYIQQMESAEPVESIPQADFPPVISRKPSSIPQKPQKKQRAYGEPNMTLGTIGAVVAGIIGMMIWYGIIRATGYEVGYIAWGVGGVVGFACRTLGGGYSKSLGVIAAACALVAIVGGEYMATKAQYDEFVDEIIEEAYVGYVAYAQNAQTLETDQEIREFLAVEWSDEYEQFSPESFSQEEIDEFRNVDIVELREVATGSSESKKTYVSQIRSIYNSPAMKGEVLKESLSLWTLLWLFLGVGTAYKLGTGETE